MVRTMFTVGMIAFSAVAASPADRQPWRAPAAADARVNPFAGRPDVTVGGRKVFAERCSVCHGKDASGTGRGPNLTTRDVQRQSDGALFWKITSGNTRTGMPGFSFLPEAQRWQLVNSLREQAGR